MKEIPHFPLEHTKIPYSPYVIVYRDIVLGVCKSLYLAVCLVRILMGFMVDVIAMWIASTPTVIVDSHDEEGLKYRTTYFHNKKGEPV